MDLYIANATKQRLQFEYRIVESKGKMSRVILPGQQTCFRDLSTPQIDSIVKQHGRYGMLPTDGLSGMKGKIDYVYCVDKPVKPAVIAQLDKHNEAVLHMRGHETRKRLAIASNDGLDKSLDQQNRAENIKGFDLTVQEIEPQKTGYRTDIAAPVAEKIELDLSPQRSDPPPQTRRPRRQKAA